jgi:hypothetical protein
MMMRVMAIVKATADSEAGKMPSEELLAAMGEFNEEMVKAGVLLAGEGLQPSSKGARVSFGGEGERMVTDGPFAETKEQLAGFYLIEARDLNDAIQVAAKIPPAREGSIEVRPVRQLDPETWV